MTGWPNRPSRTGFGPTLVNPKPLTNPKTQADADAFNLAFWQLAGMGLVMPKAWAYCSGANGSVLQHAEVWNPNRDQPVPVGARSATGQYTLTYLGTYPDEKGNPCAPGLIFPYAFVVNNMTNAIALSNLTGTVITINTKTNPGNSLTDFSFVVVVW